MRRQTTAGSGGSRRSGAIPGLVTAGVAAARTTSGRKQNAGKLVLVIGPSGAGKDTLIAAARRKFRDTPSIVFPARVITRPECVGEEHIPISRSEFLRRERDGGFFLSWQAHGLRYGIAADVRGELRSGRTVVVNVSRDVVAAATTAWPGTHVVHVTVALDALRSRLEARGRETPDDIARRLTRASRKQPAAISPIDVIDNSGHLATAVRKFNALIAGYAGISAKR